MFDINIYASDILLKFIIADIWGLFIHHLDNTGIIFNQLQGDTLITFVGVGEDLVSI